MAESYFEEAELTIQAVPMTAKSFFRTKPYSGAVTLKFLKVSPAKQLDTTSVTASKGSFAAVKWKAPAVEKNEEFYDLQVVCAYKKVSKVLLEARIWPKEVKVEIQDQDGKPKATCAFNLVQSGSPIAGSTDDKGKATAALHDRGPYTLEMASSVILLEDKQRTSGEFRDHVLKVQDAITAKFLSPDVTADPYVEDTDAAPAKKQWVNMSSDHAAGAELGGCDARGNLVVVTVTADPPDSGKKGNRVYFEVEFGRESKRNMPLPALATSLPVMAKVVADKKTTGYVELDADNGKASFELNLGIAGGDTCTVKIGGTSEVKDAELKLINWRKMYAQVTKTAAQVAPALDVAKATLKKTFIDLEEATADNVTLADSDVPAGSFVDGTVVKAGLPAKALVVGIHNAAQFKAKLKPRFASQKLPVVHIILCDEQLDAELPPFEASADVLGKKEGQTQGTVDFPGGATVPGLKVERSLAPHRDARFFAVDLNDGSDALKSCRWQEVGGTGAGDILAADTKIDQVAHGDNLFIRLPDDAKALSDAGKTIRVSYRLAFAKGWYNGWCTRGDNHVVIKLGRPDNEICGTIVHEVGHAIYQAAQAANASKFPGLAAPPHARYYETSRGHTGNHCADGIDDDAWFNDLSNKLNSAYASARCKCIMYGAGSALRNSTMAFCARCEPYVNAAPVTEVSK